MPLVDNGDGTVTLNSLQNEPSILANIPASGVVQVRPGVYRIDANLLGNDGTLLPGTGAPAPTLGKNGDAYFDTAAAELYFKTDGSWNGPFPTGGGGTPPLASVLLVGNTTGGSSIELSSGDSIASAAGSDLQLSAATGYARVGARKVTSKAFAFFVARRTVSVQNFGAGSSVMLWNEVDPDSDATVAPTPPGTSEAFHYDPATGIVTITEPGEPNEYNFTVGLNIESGTNPPRLFTVSLIINATPFGRQVNQVISASVASGSVDFNDRIRLEAGDTIVVQVDTTAGAATDNELLLGSSFSLRRTGDGT